KAPSYLGVSRNTFNRYVRPRLREIQIGPQGKAFDRLELDAWVDRNLRQQRIDSAQPGGEDGPGNSGCAQGIQPVRQKVAGRAQATLAGLGPHDRNAQRER